MLIDIDPKLLLILIPAILGTVEFLKQMGLAGKALTATSMGLGVFSAILAQIVEPGVVQVVLNGVLVGLAACGLYDVAKLIGANSGAICSSILSADSSQSADREREFAQALYNIDLKK